MSDTPDQKETQVKTSLFKNPIILAGMGLVIVGLAAGLYFSFKGKGDKDVKTPEQQELVKKEATASEKVFYFDMPDMLINLVSNSKKGNYLKVSISVEFTSPSALEKLKIFRPRIVDQYQVFLRSLRVEELRGSAGLERIREELLRRANIIVAPEKITNVLFKEIVVQ